jgi:hypothetical protein
VDCWELGSGRGVNRILCLPVGVPGGSWIKIPASFHENRAVLILLTAESSTFYSTVLCFIAVTYLKVTVTAEVMLHVRL